MRAAKSARANWGEGVQAKPNTAALPRVIEEPITGLSEDDFVTWTADHRADIEAAIEADGAVLFRGARLNSREAFERVCRALTPSLRDYVGGGSPRTHLGGRVYTSTEYPARASIPLHCEASYLPEMPKRIWFYCQIASAEGGETPIGDMRGVEQRLDQGFVEKLKRDGVLYVSNLHGGQGFGKSWMQAYESDDRAEVEARLKGQGAAYEWRADGGLRVEMRQPAMRTHSRTGQEIWSNQMVNWHPAHLGADHLARLRNVYGDEHNMPKSAFYGDGSPIAIEHVLEVAAVLEDIEVAFPWRAGDVLLLDNECVAHGRRPFSGERAVFVAMS